MAPRGKSAGGKGVLSAEVVDKRIRGMVPTKLEALFKRIADNDKAWAKAAKDPEAFLAANGINAERYRGIELGEELKRPPLVPVLPIKICPRGFHAEIRWERHCICVRWIWVPIWPPRPLPFPPLPPQLPIWVKICVKQICLWVPHWVCVRDRLIFPPIKPPRVKPPRPPLKRKPPIR